MNQRRKIIIHHNLHRSYIKEVIQVGAVGVLEEEGAEGAGLAVAVDGDNLLREVLVPTTRL